jgi:hypothetical protein
MAKDYIKPVAAAYGTGDPAVHEIGAKAIREIEDLRRELQNQASMIRELMARVPKPPPRAVEAAPRTADEPNGAKLSDEMKDKIRDLALREWHVNKRWFTAQELVDEMRKAGINFGVAQPVPSVGTVLAAARRQVESQLEGSGSAHSGGSASIG